MGDIQTDFLIVLKLRILQTWTEALLLRTALLFELPTAPPPLADGVGGTGGGGTPPIPTGDDWGGPWSPPAIRLNFLVNWHWKVIISF